MGETSKMGALPLKPASSNRGAVHLQHTQSMSVNSDMAVQDVEVAFRGVEVGELEALQKTTSSEYKSRPYSSALEDSAVAGEISHDRAAFH